MARGAGKRGGHRPPASDAARKHHARTARPGRRDFQAHAVRRARSRARKRQEGAARAARADHGDRQIPHRAVDGSGAAPGQERGQPRHRAAGRTHRGGQAAGGHDHAHRSRGGRRRHARSRRRRARRRCRGGRRESARGWSDDSSGRAGRVRHPQPPVRSGLFHKEGDRPGKRPRRGHGGGQRDHRTAVGNDRRSTPNPARARATSSSCRSRSRSPTR